MTNNKPFDFGADSDRNPDQVIFERNFYNCGIGTIVSILHPSQ